jgi:uncharacterized protein YbjQ (UPF0145 family)
MTSWDGRGLPPAAAARIERAKATRLSTSLLSVPAAYSVESVGFEPVGEVMGCIVERISYAGYGATAGYGYGASPGYSTPVITSASRYYGYGPFVKAMTNGWNTAMRRMQQEAQGLGADGVVGVALTQNHLDGNTREFVAIGTAVRALTRRKYELAAPFTTDLSGADFAKLLLSGWMPVAVRIGYEVASRYDDYYTARQAGRSWQYRNNVEVSGYTQLVQKTREIAREKFARAIREAKADGGIVSHIGLQIWEGESSHTAEATIRGTAIAAFRRSNASAPTPLTMIPTRPMRSRGK